MLARDERPADRGQQFAGQQLGFVDRRRLGQADGELGTRQPRDQTTAAVARTRQPLDPACDRADDRVADAAPERGVDHVEAAEADHDEDRPLPARQPRLDPAARAVPVVEPGQRIARRGVRPGAQAVERLDMADDVAVLEHQMVRDPAPVDGIVRERRDPALVAQPPDRVQRGPHADATQQPLRLAAGQLAGGIGQATRLRQCGADRQRRGMLGRPAPRHRLARDQPRAAGRRAVTARQPLGMARGEAQRLRELAFRERRREILRRACLERRRHGRRLAPPDQQQQRRAIGLHRVRQHAGRRQPLGERIARVDHDDRRAARQEAPLEPVAAPRRDRRPAGALGHVREFVALAERQQEQRRRTGRCVGGGRNEASPRSTPSTRSRSPGTLDAAARRANGHRRSACPVAGAAGLADGPPKP